MGYEKFQGFESLDDIRSKFEVSEDEKLFPTEDELLLAYNESCNDGYAEEAHIYFVRDGQLYAVYASHCSCYGYEDKWGPEKEDWELVKKHLESWSEDTWLKERFEAVNKMFEMFGPGK